MWRARLSFVLLVCLRAPSLDASVGRSATMPRSFSDCERLVRERPRDLDGYRCFWTVAGDRMDAAAAALERLLRKSPGEPRALLYLGTIEGLRSKPRAARLLREAAAGLAREGEWRGELYARTSLAWNLIERGRYGDARTEIQRAGLVAAELRDEALLAMVDLWRGYLAFYENDFARAARFYRRAERALFPDGPRWLRQRFLHWFARLQVRMGRYREALLAALREAEILRGAGNTHLEPFARFNAARAARPLMLRGELDRASWDALVARALDTARRAKNRPAEANTRLFLLAAPSKDPAEALRQTRIVEGLLGGMEDFPRSAQKRLLAKALWHAEPARRDEALRIMDGALSYARSRREAAATATVLVDRAYLYRLAGRRAEALRDGLEAVTLLGRVRRLQPDPLVGARAGADMAHVYPLVSAWILEGPRSPGDIDVAFRILEEQRARSILDAFERGSRREEGSAARRRAELGGRIADVQRRLLGPLSTPERDRLLAELTRLEATDEILRDEIARAARGTRRVPAAPASLADVQRALAADQAMLFFQIVPGDVDEARLAEDAASFVLSVTRDTVRAHRVHAGAGLDRTAELLARAVARRDGSETLATVRLYRELLGDGLAALPSTVSRLIVVPDGALHRVPFELLRPSLDAAPLGSRYALSVAPSAGVWLRFKSRPRSAPAAVLALADPALAARDQAAEREETAPWLTGLRLGRLPHGAREAALAVSALREGGLLWRGDEASERQLKGAALSRYGVLHLAAHAVMDEEHPERSAVVLTPGGAKEDGLLQAREVAALDLRDRLVVLSACRSSTGALLRGEGLQSLARSFLEAGARAVVGNLWPVRDDEAEAMMAAFYRRLGSGKNVSESLAGARRERIRAGAPAAAWAGVVVVGDGDLSFPPKRLALLPWTLAAALALVPMVGWARRRLRAR
jgi:CHAT domain-containing protein